ncbi:MAG TPA: GFA family protein [Allosphingosinicella sp.]|nr:GFA family protein [Allosphingosinicella sp.]
MSGPRPTSRATASPSGARTGSPWFQSSEKIRRGFCKTCGSALFWDPPHKDWTSIALGAFDPPTGTRLEMHIWVSQQGDYYDIADGLPQHDT